MLLASNFVTMNSRAGHRWGDISPTVTLIPGLSRSGDLNCLKNLVIQIRTIAGG